MRILILSHPRSGSFTLASWLAKEINATLFIDPIEEVKNNHCVVRSTNLAEDLNPYDCVIVHFRKDAKETAISRAYLQLNPNYDPHMAYTITDHWIFDNYSLIEELAAECRTHNEMLRKIKRDDLIHTTYEKCYVGNASIEAIAELIGMNKPFKYADIIHHTKRYQILRKWKSTTRGII
jgi:hypothetical protein